MKRPGAEVVIPLVSSLLYVASGVLGLMLAVGYGQWYIWPFVFATTFGTAANSRSAGLALACQYARSQRPSQDCRPPVPVLPLPALEPLADGLHVRVRAIGFYFDEHAGWRVPFYRAQVWRGDELMRTLVSRWPTEEQAQTTGEECICRIRAGEELKAAGQHEAAEMVWNL